MYISKLELDVVDKQVGKDTASFYEMHRTLSKAFPSREDGGMKRVIFNYDDEPNIIIVQSLQEPNWNKISDSYFSTPPLVKNINFSIKNNDVFMFKAKVNPTKTHKGKNVGLNSDQSQHEWLNRKAVLSGFNLLDVNIKRKYNMASKKKGMLQSFSVAEIEGVVQVTDSEKFTYMLENGMGRARAYGCGLFQIMRKQT